jgi:serine/threonine protein kinase
MSKHDPYINKLIFGKYLIRKKVGKGSFGTVYQGVNTATNEKIALKVEKREKNDQGTLENEALRLVYLQGEGVPKVYCYGNNLVHNLLVEELLGKSLEDLFNAHRKPFSLKTVCVLGIEMIKRIQYIHSKHYIHRDIKPDNFMIGRGANKNKIYIIDFGLAKKYYSVSKGQHIKFITGKQLIGTARYCGRNAHKGYEQGRRDDIESIGYVLMYFLLGVLPWQGLKVKKNEDQFEKIGQKKISTSFEELTAGQPQEFLNYFKYCDKLDFEAQPNYLYLMGLFQNIIDRFCKVCFYDYDWNKDSYIYHSREVNLRKSVDVSLIVNKNNDASGVEYSNFGNEDENDDDGEGHSKNKKIRKKEVFMGEDKTPIENHENEEDDFNNYKNNGKIQRSKSMVNINKKNSQIINKDMKKKHYRGSNKNNNQYSKEYKYNSSQKKEKDDYDNRQINREEEDNQEENNNEENYCKNNENNDNNNNDYDYENKNYINNNNIMEYSDNYNPRNKRRSISQTDINEYNLYRTPNKKYRTSREDFNNNNSHNRNQFNLDDEYNGKGNNENEKDENNEDINQTEEGEKEEIKEKGREDDDNHYKDKIEDFTFESEGGNKKKRRNRSGSVDDKNYRENNVKCACNIF